MIAGEANSDAHRVLAPERQKRLVAELEREGALRVDVLAERLGASVATIRRDLEALEQCGLAQRVHGGAVSAHARMHELPFDDKTAIAVEEKRGIARAALELVQDGETVFIDGGSTALELARLLAARERLTVVTNSLRAAVELAAGGPRLILIGGELRRRSQTIVGTLTRRPLETAHFDRAFMGTMGLTLEDGLSTSDPNEAFTKELVMAQARQVVLLAHHAKIGKVAFANAGGLGEVDVLITDAGADASFVRAARRIGLRVVTVDRDGKPTGGV